MAGLSCAPDLFLKPGSGKGSGWLSVSMSVYFVLPLSAFNLSLAPACAAASRAVSTRNGEQAT